MLQFHQWYIIIGHSLQRVVYNQKQSTFGSSCTHIRSKNWKQPTDHITANSIDFNIIETALVKQQVVIVLQAAAFQQQRLMLFVVQQQFIDSIQQRGTIAGVPLIQRLNNNMFTITSNVNKE